MLRFMEASHSLFSSTVTSKYLLDSTRTRFLQVFPLFFSLESDPCLVCNNPEVPFTSLKLSNLKVDTKYTTTTQIVKLASSHSISKICLRIGDLKRQKMVRSINIFFNNRSVQAVVELKNRSTLWHKAKKVALTAGQTDIKIEFPLPIVACNLMIEYADFYENIQASSETLQCPRCSASVPANPGNYLFVFEFTGKCYGFNFIFQNI